MSLVLGASLVMPENVMLELTKENGALKGAKVLGKRVFVVLMWCIGGYIVCECIRFGFNK